MKVANITTPNDWDDIYSIPFKFNQLKKSIMCDSLMAFDIEVSNGWRQPDGSVIGFDHELYNTDDSYKEKIDNGEPISLMYVWQIAIEGGDYPLVFMGRTWDEYNTFIHMLTAEIRRQAFYGIKSTARDIETATALKMKDSVSAEIYIHSAGFEFQHLRNIWEKDFCKKSGQVFARQARKPMKWNVYFNRVRLEHRDSLVLTQKSLATWCKDEKLPVQKLQEPKDYYLEIRTPETPLTPEEICYSINDVVSMLYGLEKYRDKEKYLKDIPLTQTGGVRKKCREKVCLTDFSWSSKCADITNRYTPERFKDLVHLFQGGWTHANRFYVNKTLKNIKCIDFASSYPGVMVSRRFPCSDFKQVDVSDFDILASQDIHTAEFRWYAQIKVKNITSKLCSTYWSTSKVVIDGNHPLASGIIADNGRIYHADEITIMCTDLDWDTFTQAYTIEDYEVQRLYKARADYLSPELISTILEYYAYKTSLKGQAGSESLYTESKQFINSIYGVAVTKIITSLIEFNKNGWTSTEPTDENIIDAVAKYNFENTFIAYQHGVWVTAWARHNLWDFILNMDPRVVYCDTDSIKGMFTDEDVQFINDYNDGIKALENSVAATLGIDPNAYAPKTATGKVKRIGIMEWEDECEEFKTLGAKRYVDLVDGKIHCTIAGLPKSAGENKIKSVDEFTDKLVWNTRESEKLIARYNDNQSPATWSDRDGNTFYSEDKYGICLQPTTFDLSMGEEFKHFLDMLMNGELDNSDEYFNDTPSILI